MDLWKILRLNPERADPSEPERFGIGPSLKRDGGSCSKDFSAFVIAFDWVEEVLKLTGDLRGWVFPSTLSASGHIANLSHLYARIGTAGGTKFWYHGLRNAFITVAERDLLLPRALTKRLVNHARPGDVTEGYAADWTIGQLRGPAQQIADRIDRLMNASATGGAVAASSDGCPAARTASAE